MKKVLVLCCSVLTSLALTAAPAKALLIVQNHVGSEFEKPLTALSSRLAAALSGEIFSVIDPNDVVGTNQNRLAAGEIMPQASAVRLAERNGAAVLITASVDDFSEVTVGSPVLAKRLRATITLQAKSVPDGATQVGAETTAMSRNFTTAEFSSNQTSAYADLVSTLSKNAAALLTKRAAGVAWSKSPNKVEIAFGCNYPGAIVLIDGIAAGTAGTVGGQPLKAKVSPGIHRVRIEYPFAVPYDFEADFSNGVSFMISLEETAEGRERRQQDAFFNELLNRMSKSGATDDFCRSEKAKGYAKYLSSSHVRLEGMPQTLTKWNWGADEPNFGLNPDIVEDKKEVK